MQRGPTSSDSKESRSPSSGFRGGSQKGAEVGSYAKQRREEREKVRKRGEGNLHGGKAAAPRSCEVQRGEEKKRGEILGKKARGGTTAAEVKGIFNAIMCG